MSLMGDGLYSELVPGNSNCRSIFSAHHSPHIGVIAMLPRVLEPEAMDTPDEARDYDAMDHAAVNGRFIADFLEVHGPCRGGEILDVGTGPARIPIALCRADDRARVLG